MSERMEQGGADRLARGADRAGEAGRVGAGDPGAALAATVGRELGLLEPATELFAEGAVDDADIAGPRPTPGGGDAGREGRNEAE